MRTRKETHHALSVLFGALLVAAFAGCFSDPSSISPNRPGSAGTSSLGGASGAAGEEMQDDGGSTAMGDAGAAPRNGKCLPVVGESFPQRSSILSQTVLPTQREVFVADLYTKFLSDCGACHAKGQGLGNFKVPDNSGYAAVLKAYVPKMLERIQSEDRNFAMPPLPPVPYSKLAKGDSLRALVQLMQEWSDAGFSDPFYEKLSPSVSQSPYAMSTEQGLGFTNIGTCVPEGNFPYANDKKAMVALDEAFAKRVASTDVNAAPEDKLGLPVELSDTDLTSFDSEVLARTGLVAFVPTYPLWSDDAGKLRYVRVPYGKSITFDAKTQQFTIPDNTRFYKTFMKEVTDKNGSKRWRKLETRLIVARHDSTSPKDVANYKPQSLFGTYKWDEDETRATLVTDKLRSGEPFTDQMYEYTVDEPKAEEIRAKMPVNLSEELEYNQVARHWAIPGKSRCIHCHEGSLNDNFILGFTPMQINRRKLGEGGVYEAPSDDELGQLQRLIDLGVITGVKSSDDIVKLEDSQLGASPPREARNDAELKAQAYLLANCAHCHNPNGFPSVSNPELTNVFNLYPGKRAGEADVGGVFQFPLETYSPRINRVVTNPTDDTRIAYITPSLHDIEGRGADGDVPKFVDNDDPNSSEARKFVSVPWRSLIYRNVYTPFTYADARIVYPHMPFDSAGHDCRAAQWLGAWMVSIPAVRKHPELPESCVDVTCQDVDAQPYVEVLPGDPAYAKAASAAKQRLAAFTNDPENTRCVDNSDIVDPLVLSGKASRPRDISYKSFPERDGVPDHAHWVITDLTERAGLWTPRRDDWKSILVDHEFPAPPTDSIARQAFEDQKAIVDLLGSKHLSDVKSFANAKFPLALWQNKPNCKLDSQRTVKSYAANERPHWFDKSNADPEAHVFQVHPGQAVFDMICINCHGPNADSLGRQADLLQTMTGGRSRVANFRSGLFNPAPQDDPYDKPDLGLLVNRPRVFGPYASAGVSTDDWGARYLAWMALGGTQAEIPQLVLDQVSITGDAGLNRTTLLSATGANMLQVAQGACLAVEGYAGEKGTPPVFHFRERELKNNPLIPLNGDQELWQRICALANPLIVRAITPRLDADGNPLDDGALRAYATPVCDSQGQPTPCYPRDAAVGNQFGETVSSLDPASNTFAWCLSSGFGSISAEKLQAFAQANLHDGKPLPICPASWEASVTTIDHLADSKVWANRGAINAGFLVFDFLDKFIKGEMGHVRYNECELLTSN
ncbi:MAG TPA: hypothetical protein VER11_35275 [Polyangiaceae bacterium]|nr:hypothetical protein [Polyangiaceae bacterium]